MSGYRTCDCGRLMDRLARQCRVCWLAAHPRVARRDLRYGPSRRECAECGREVIAQGIKAHVRSHDPAFVEGRFWSKVDRRGADECWPWTGSLNPNGYGTFFPKTRKPEGAHRFAYRLVVGEPPSGTELDHLCRNPSCVNPAHLDPVTHRENVLRGVSPAAVYAASAACIAKHDLTPENTYVRPNGSRHCRECKRRRDHDYYAARRAAA